MQRWMILALGGAAGLLLSPPVSRLSVAQEAPEPPVAKVVPKELFVHGDVRVDNYYWLNDLREYSRAPWTLGMHLAHAHVFLLISCEREI